MREHSDTNQLISGFNLSRLEISKSHLRLFKTLAKETADRPDNLFEPNPSSIMSSIQVVNLAKLPVFLSRALHSVGASCSSLNPQEWLRNKGSDTAPFGFVDTETVVCAAYIMPAFDHVVTDVYLGPSPSALAPQHLDDDDEEDFVYHHVGM